MIRRFTEIYARPTYTNLNSVQLRLSKLVLREYGVSSYIPPFGWTDRSVVLLANRQSLLTWACSLLLVTVAAQACTSISYTSAIQTTCTPLDTCNGLLCFNSLRKRNVSFSVQSCSDPVLVNYTILHSETGALISSRQLNGSFVLGNASHEMQWNISRNASHLFIQVPYNKILFASSLPLYDTHTYCCGSSPLYHAIIIIIYCYYYYPLLL